MVLGSASCLPRKPQDAFTRFTERGFTLLECTVHNLFDVFQSVPDISRRLLRNAMLSHVRGTMSSVPFVIGKGHPEKASHVRLLGALALLRNVHTEPTVARMQAGLGLSDRLLGQHRSCHSAI